MKVKSTRTLAVAAIAAIGVLGFLFSKSAAIEAAYPFQKVKRWFSRSVVSRISGAWNGAAAKAENELLRRNLAALALENGEYERIYAENIRLRQTLDYAQKSKQESIPAEVLSYGGGSVDAFKSIRVGKGSFAGVREGAAVEVPEGLVGRVVSVTPHTSEIMLITDPSVKVSCRVEAKSPLTGVLTGGSESLLSLKFLKPGVEILPRAKVYTSGFGGVFPPGIEVGTFCTDVESVAQGAGGLEGRGGVLPAVDFTTLKDVFIRK
jgi:rod shape-determining protein MreC